LILVTHDPQLAARCDRRLRLVNGMMQALRADGLGTADHSAIACYYEKLAKVEITR
jgi:ABC-type lipoprotein export system ATPase subunit